MNFTFGISFGSGCVSSICAVASNILYIINNILVPVIFAIAFIVFLYGVASKYIFSHGDAEKVAEGHRLILWGLIGFVVMVSLWGLVNVVANTFGLAGAYTPPTPIYYPTTAVPLYGQQTSPSVNYIECPKDASGHCI